MKKVFFAMNAIQGIFALAAGFAIFETGAQIVNQIH